MQRDESVQTEQPINAHTLTTHLRKRGKTRRLLSQAAKVYRRFERARVNDLWQADAMAGPWLPDPYAPGKKRRTHLFCFIDDHSRLVPYAEFFFDEAMPSAYGVERVLPGLAARAGKVATPSACGVACLGPRRRRVDNGQVYSATQFGAVPPACQPGYPTYQGSAVLARRKRKTGTIFRDPTRSVLARRLRRRSPTSLP